MDANLGMGDPQQASITRSGHRYKPSDLEGNTTRNGRIYSVANKISENKKKTVPQSEINIDELSSFLNSLQSSTEDQERLIIESFSQQPDLNFFKMLASKKNFS